MFHQGDMVHVPENVTVYSYLSDHQMIWPTSTTKKAVLGVFIEHCDLKYAEVLSDTGEKIIVEKESLHFKGASDAC